MSNEQAKKPLRTLEDFVELCKHTGSVEDTVREATVEERTAMARKASEASWPMVQKMSADYNALGDNEKIGMMMASSTFLGMAIGARAGDTQDLDEGLTYFLNYIAQCAQEHMARMITRSPPVPTTKQ